MSETLSGIARRLERITSTISSGRRHYILVISMWDGDLFWLMTDDGAKGQYVKTLTPEEAEEVEPGILARCRAERLARFPAADVSDRLFALEQKKGMFETGEISLTPEEAEALEKEIRALADEYEDLAFPGSREAREGRLQAAQSDGGDKV